ncbi:MAG TPA: TIM-barrel domain-containing protein [Rhodanobacteraceae bacterium]|nr:TIM-barrel domain-containing protein [Rhodanobacteraceae bacterium]
MNTRIRLKRIAVMLLALALLIPGCVQATSAVTVGNARFEFLTPTLVRMEYSPSGKFVDVPTAVVEQRDWPDVEVHRKTESGWLIASTNAMTLRYKLQSGAFTAVNLTVSWKDHGAMRTWHPGQVDDRNLGGLTYSLDNVSTKNLPKNGDDLGSPINDLIPGIDVLLPQAQPGLLSRSGYAFIDDSKTPLWNAKTQWIEPRESGGAQDGYLFAYGRDYRKALAEYAQLCGVIPMIPRYVLGPMITDLNFEYFPGSAQTKSPEFRRYGEEHLEDEVARFRQNHIPLDTLVLDFAWHNYGWDGGYDWSPLIPHPDRLLKWLHDRGVKVSLNDHPGYANTQENILSPEESHAPDVLRALGKPMPPKPSFDLDLSLGWRFAVDPHDQGIREHWYASDYDDSKWKPIRIDASPKEQGYADDKNIVWYRRQVRLPAHLPPHLYLYLSQQSKNFQLYVDGHEIAHSPVHWPQRVTFADIAPYAHAGATMEIALRLEPSEYGSGFLRGLTAICDVEPPGRIWFDLSNKQQAEVSMRYLHDPLLKQGVDFWWVDGGSGAARMPGLDPQLWTNRVFYDSTQHTTGKRGFILGRYGSWGSERYPGYFTGDTYSEWPVLRYEVAYTARGGNVLIPYMSHDIGGFHGGKIDFDLYARWLEFGAFSPILRLHSAHENPREGNLRMPWTYGSRGMALAKKYFTLREQLIPYLYTYAWIAHRQSLPLLRPLYLHDPDSEESYKHPHEYFFGDEMLVAPVLDASGQNTIWLPPGQWIGFFDGKRHEGSRSFAARYATDQIPVFVRDGAMVPEQPAMGWSDQRPLDRLVINVYGSGNGFFTLYEDDGESLDYETHHALTPISNTANRDGSHRIVIGPARRTFDGQVQRRSYDLQLRGIDKPASISLDGKRIDGWSWNAGSATASVSIPARDIRQAVTIDWRAAR